MKENLKYYEQLVAVFPEVERKGKTMPYTSMNGNMFSFLDKKGNMGLRLSKEDRGNFIQKFDSKLMEQHGRIMKEYVVIPATLLKNTDALSEYFQLSVEYVRSLKAKASKKKK